MQAPMLDSLALDRPMARSTIIDDEARLRWWRRALPWTGAGLVAFPSVVLLHEIGHYLCFRAFRFPGAVMHYASADYTGSSLFERRLLLGDVTGAASIVPISEVAIATAAGLLITYLCVILAGWWTARHSPHPLVVAIGLASPLRFISLRWLLFDLVAGRPVLARTDEGLLIVITRLPPLLFIAAGFACWIGGWIFLIRRWPRGGRLFTLGALLVGTALGVVLYANVVGPWLLP